MYHQLNHQLKKLQLNYAQFVVLAVLVLDSRGTMDQHDFRKYLNLSKMRVSKYLKYLQANGFVYYMDHIWDGRAKTIRATKRGEIALREALKLVEGFERRQMLELKLRIK